MHDMRIASTTEMIKNGSAHTTSQATTFQEFVIDHNSGVRSNRFITRTIAAYIPPAGLPTTSTIKALRTDQTQNIVSIPVK
jgi:hypothetical protein